MHPRLIQLGSLTIPTSAVFTAIAIVAALGAARLAARRLDLDPEKLWDLGIVSIVSGIFAPRLVFLAENWRDFLAHPLWMIGLLRVRSGAATVGGIGIALLVAGTFVFFTRMPFRRTLDALAPSLALGLAITGLGAFAGGAGFGTPTKLPWAVTYTSRLASLWNGAPLGTPVHPVQLYVSLSELLFLLVLIWMVSRRERWRLRSGEIMGTWLFLHGLSSFAFDFLRGDLAASGFALLQSAAGLMVIAGGMLWLL